MQLNGIFILAELPEEIGERVRTINERYDPKLARYKPPHITLTGSSGAGPMPPSVDIEVMRQKLEPIADETSPITLRFPIRVLHDKIIGSGLPFTRARYTFSPHCTLSLYPSLDPKSIRELLSTRIPEPFVISAIQLYHTRDPQPSRKLLELPLLGGSAKA